MPANATTGGFGTRNYFIPNAGMDVKKAQVLHGVGYVTINLKGAHYRSEGNLWQKIFGGNDSVSLSTQVTHTTSNANAASIEETREIKVGDPYYFGSGRPIAINLPTDSDAIEMSVTISAIKNDNLSAALNMLNSGELQSTLSLAPPVVSEALGIANVVKKLLTNTNPQDSLQADFAGRLSVTPSDDPIRDYCMVQGTIIFIYRESEDDTSLDDLDTTKLTTDGDGLKYDGTPVQNTYTMFQISWADVRGEDPTSQWYSSFSTADQTLDGLITATSDADKQKLWASAYATYLAGIKLLMADPTYTQDEAKSIAATHLAALQQKYTSGTAQPKPPAPAPTPMFLSLSHQALLNDVFTNGAKAIAGTYLERLARSNVSLPGPLVKHAKA